MTKSGVEHYIAMGRKAKSRHLDEIDKIKKCHFDTIAVHGLYTMNEALNFNQGSIVEPLYMATAQAYRDADEMEAALSYQIPSWCYSRLGNPTMYYFEQTLALLEGYGKDIQTSCCATSSGMSAIASATDPFLSIDPTNPAQKINFVATCQVYGGTFQQFAVRKALGRGVECRWIKNSLDLDEWNSKIDENTRFVYGEMPSNPSQGFFDLDEVIDLAHQKGVPVIIDNTVGTPALLRPLTHGADIVVQSVTKTLTSSGFGVGGALISRKNIVSHFAGEELKSDFAAYVKAMPNRDTGPNISPFNALLAISDMRTLRSKVDLMSRNAMEVAGFLQQHKKIETVDYLGLKDHPNHQLASKYLILVDSEYDKQYQKRENRYGHLMSFNVKGGPSAARKMFDRLERIWRATDLGRIKSVATIPAISTHSQQGEAGRALAQIPPNMVRLCVGAEHPQDVIDDLDCALQSIDRGATVQVPYEYSIGGASNSIAAPPKKLP